MSYKLKITFNANAHPDYAEKEVEFPELWAFDYYAGTCLMLNSKTSAEDKDTMLLLPWHSITRVSVEIE